MGDGLITLSQHSQGVSIHLCMCDLKKKNTEEKVIKCQVILLRGSAEATFARYQIGKKPACIVYELHTVHHIS